MKTTTQEIALKVAAQLPQVSERIATETDEHELQWLQIHRDNLLAIASLCRALNTMGAEIARIALAPIFPPRQADRSGQGRPDHPNLG
jgi:hypothetical protein